MSKFIISFGGCAAVEAENKDKAIAKMDKELCKIKVDYPFLKRIYANRTWEVKQDKETREDIYFSNDKILVFLHWSLGPGMFGDMSYSFTINEIDKSKVRNLIKKYKYIGGSYSTKGLLKFLKEKGYKVKEIEEKNRDVYFVAPDVSIMNF